MKCTVVNQLLTPCKDLGDVIGAVNIPLDKIGVSKIAVYQYVNEDYQAERDIVFALSSQGDDTPRVFNYCPFCREKISTEVAGD